MSMSVSADIIPFYVQTDIGRIEKHFSTIVKQHGFCKMGSSLSGTELDDAIRLSPLRWSDGNCSWSVKFGKVDSNDGFMHVTLFD